MFPSNEQLISLSKSPCCLDVFPGDFVISGTYELENEQTDGDNYRKGSLCIVKSKQLLLEHECQDGGVFDLQILPPNHVLVAHANGCLVLYSVSDDHSDLKMVARSETGSNLLTSLNAIPCSESSSHWVCAGTSDGDMHLFLLSDMTVFESCSSIRENRHKQPVWCVRIVVLQDQLFIISGSDDCKWKVFTARGGVIDDHPIHTNSDAESGVTSVSLHLEQQADRLCGSLLVGSYDEHMRSYALTITSDLLVEVTRKSSQHFPGSGVWRIRSANMQAREHLLIIAGMYSGVHFFDAEKRETDSKDWPAAQNNTTSEGKELIYDVVRLKSGTLVVASFYLRCLRILSYE